MPTWTPAKAVTKHGHGAGGPCDEGVVPWFYRTLRNAATDRFRRNGTASRAIETFARELDVHAVPDGEMEAEICACVGRLAATLKPEHVPVRRLSHSPTSR
ncbi:MAG: hypothetical protein ABL971_17000 [Vicinamibacterales bacterium]